MTALSQHVDPRAVRRAQETWDRMAPTFDPTRTRPWSPVVRFLDGLPRGQRVLDAGAGNGRHTRYALALGHRVVALDVSAALLDRLRRRCPEAHAVQAALQRVPLRSASFDAAIAVASVHHVEGRAQRLLVWRELRRLLGPGARLLATVWSKDQPRFASLATGDVDLPWRASSPPLSRFVHLYKTGELEGEIKEAGFVVIEARPLALATPAPDNHLVIATTPSL